MKNIILLLALIFVLSTSAYCQYVKPKSSPDDLRNLYRDKCSSCVIREIHDSKDTTAVVMMIVTGAQLGDASGNMSIFFKQPDESAETISWNAKLDSTKGLNVILPILDQLQGIHGLGSEFTEGYVWKYVWSLRGKSASLTFNKKKRLAEYIESVAK